ncbi:hypothetical protein PV327_005779 [Microctonus hyperodae]|uniref:C-type lectin domain-containing protein n=1 Tax=Microctonus hyperodae TaxID=165561 RepID=A0AA39G234_MICHY|nr:hypothetical protein PV327_005779 [Microctonus hyperodae]
MWLCGILLLCATGLSFGNVVDSHINSVNAPINNYEKNVKDTFGPIRRFACPVGFFRLKRNCYYLSAGVAPWREAYFHCKDRNATLAVLDKNGKDRILRKYLMGDQFTKFERWIGGVYNWQQMAWEWGVSGDKIVFQNFAHEQQVNPKQYAWHCIVLDPFAKYKWNPRSCIQKKHYICEVPAGRIDRRRRKRIHEDPNLVPQNQRMKPKRKGKKIRKEKKGEIGGHRRNRDHRNRQRNWAEQNPNREWANGVNLGSRPLSEMKGSSTTRPTNRTRHRPNRLYKHDKTPKITQIKPQGYTEYSQYLGDGPAATHLKTLVDEKSLAHYHAKINDLSLEEILLKT